jgi:tetratricopeptide (TPR) repeat protein
MSRMNDRKGLSMRIALSLICISIFAAGSAGAQTGEAGARASGRDGKSVAPETSPELEEAVRLNAEVVKLYSAGRYDEALPLARRVLELREKALGEEHILVGYALNNLASIYADKGSGDEAEPLFKRALGIFDKTRVTNDLTADINTQLGLIKLGHREYKEAELLMSRALEIKEKVHGADAPAVVPALFNLTDVHFLRRDFDEGTQFLRRARA